MKIQHTILQRSPLHLIYTSFLLVLLLFTCNEYALAGEESSDSDNKNLYEMSFKELAQLQYSSVSILTQVAPRDIPNAMTIITHDMIRSSGARSLQELLEIYVPGLQISSGPVEELVAVRGIVPINNDSKTVILVNGHPIQARAEFRHGSEFSLSMLNDIAYIEVIRGGGSVTIGSGVMNLVVNIKTFNADNFEGFEIGLRQGGIEEFSALQLKYGHKFNYDQGFFAFLGIQRYQGADRKDAPYFQSLELNGLPAHHPQEIGENYHYGNYGWPAMKLHLEYSSESFTSWLRFTANRTATLAVNPLFPQLENFGQVRTLTFFNQHRQQLSDNLLWKNTYSFDWMESFTLGIRPTWQRTDTHSERLHNFSSLLNWTGTKQQLTIGAEFSYGEFGLDPKFYPHEDHSSLWGYQGKVFETTTYAFLFEHQWKPIEDLTFITAGRWDYHSLAKGQLSPKFSAIYHATEHDTFKFNLASSFRYLTEMRLKQLQEADSNDIDGKDYINSVELIHVHRFNDSLVLTNGLSYSQNHIIGTDGFANKFDLFTYEGELSYRTDSMKVALSHSWTKASDFSGNTDSIFNFTTSAPFGYGDDLIAWSNHLTKLNATFDVTPELSSSVSVIHYWGFPGSQDYADWSRDPANPFGIFLNPSDGSKAAYKGATFVNLGFEWKISKQASLNVTAHNVLSILDERLSRRSNRISSEYTLEPAAFSLQFIYKF